VRTILKQREPKLEELMEISLQKVKDEQTVLDAKVLKAL